MLDLSYLENFTQEAIERLNLRGGNYGSSIKELVKLNQVRKLNLARVEQSRAQKNQFTQSIWYLMQTIGNQNQLKTEIEVIKQEIAKLDIDIKIISQELEKINHQIKLKGAYIPNLPTFDTPIGKTEANNVEISIHNTDLIGHTKKVSHWEIAQKLGWVSSDLGAKLSGSRFLVYRGLGAKMIRALSDILLDFHGKNGYTEYNIPLIVNEEAMENTGQLPKFKEDAYQIDTGQYLIPTSEVPLTNFVAHNLLNRQDLPLNFTAYSPCFRQEAGSAGRDTRGMIRLHQFNKVELVKIVAQDKEGVEFNNLVEEVKHALNLFNLPYRVINLCTGDLGFSAMKTYDFEVWLPSQNKYREISSCSSCGDFQARNMHARYRDEDNTTKFVHTLNGSGVAIDRLLAAILENYWDGEKLVLPKVLQSYFENKKYLD